MIAVWKALLSMMLVALVLLPLQAKSQEATQSPAFSKEQIEQLVAPIALYPDPLLSQILMASTYPLEIVSAARWLKANPNLKDKALDDALQQQNWDPSVKSLTMTPQALELLNHDIDMTQKLGDAFLAQQKEVLNAVQRLRAKAQEKGNLKSNKEQVINSTQEGDSSVITILPADPEIIYVPTYDPNVMYGTWPYPSYPPYAYYPPNYEVGTALISFGLGLAVGNVLWGNFNWRDGNVHIDINRYNNFNKTTINDGNWHHDAAHREGVPYRDRASQEKYGKEQLKDNRSREQFRERADQGQKELKRERDKALNGKASNAHSKQIANKKSEMPNKAARKGNQAKQLNKAKPHQKPIQQNRPAHREIKQQRKPQSLQGNRGGQHRGQGGHGARRGGGRR